MTEPEEENQMSDGKISILGFAGSLRKDSFNKALLNAAAELVPDGARLATFDLEGLPLFNQDNESKPNAKLAEFKAAIRSADAILIATPEYNYSMPGVLKNAIDCASRPYGDNAWEGKPAAIMGASIGMLGTARAQYHLRQTCVVVNMFPLNRPEVMVTFAQGKIGKDGNLNDEETRKKIRELLESLIAWAGQLKGK
jgi:chromate reductase